MNAAINSYLESVLDTNDRESIPDLLNRKSPFKDWAIYYFIKCIVFLKKFPNNFVFKEIIPFHLPHKC